MAAYLASRQPSAGNQYGVEIGGVLVRADGYVAGRGRSGTPESGEVPRAGSDRLLCRTRRPALSAE
jgi:hypothetical protein